MEWQKLCTNCMLAPVVNGVCPYCGTPDQRGTRRDVRALPSRYMLHGRYYIGKVLGVGGFGVTYLAYDCQRNSRVAVKELFPNKDAVREQGTCAVRILKGQEEYFRHVRQRFIGEARILFQFQKSPDVIDVYQLFEENNTAYYVMEYLEGTDLKHYLLNRGRLDWSSLSGYARMIFKTLSTLHRQNLIHRDISPDNIFLTKDGRAILIDFGSVRCYSNSKGFTTFLKECFAPLEQYREHGRQGPWTDVYSLSVTMYYALSGVMPPKAPDRIQDDQTVPLHKLCPALPGHVARAIEKGMSVRQEERFQNVQDYAKALFPGESLLENAGGAPHQAYRLNCVRGYYKGRSWPFHAGAAVTLGRDGRCMIAYPPDSKGVSRLQCSLMMDRQGRVFVRDEKSTYGTFLDGKRLPSGRWCQMTCRNCLNFGNEIYQIR